MFKWILLDSTARQKWMTIKNTQRTWFDELEFICIFSNTTYQSQHEKSVTYIRKNNSSTWKGKWAQIMENNKQNTPGEIDLTSLVSAHTFKWES